MTLSGNIQATVLLADDDRSIRTVLTQALGRIGCRVRAAGSVSALWRMIEDGEGDIVITDVHMPDGDALDLLPAIRKRRSDLPVIVMSAQNTVLTAIRAAEMGAYEYFPKPFDLNHLIDSVRKSNEKNTALSTPNPRENSQPQENLPLIGGSPAMQDVYRIIARVTHTDLTVMITGESGTGKELVARALHNFGRRKHHPFVALNMAAIPRELIESELFGHEKGAFTGATERGIGKFEQAQGGTLFLDEIGDMPIDAQTRLLRVLQEGEFTSVGGRNTQRTDVRIIAATHQDLRLQIADGRFREDLYYRLNVVPVRIPPLRERTIDIPDLARDFLRRAAAEGLPHKMLDQDGLNRLMAHDWPGNVRELENLIRRLAALCPDETIPIQAIEQELASQTASIPFRSNPSDVASQTLGEAVEVLLSRYFEMHGDDLPPAGLYNRVLREIEIPLLTLSLLATNGNQIKAAEMLGINRNTLRKKIQSLDISVTRGKKVM